jgi:hypothetical protein
MWLQAEEWTAPATECYPELVIHAADGRRVGPVSLAQALDEPVGAQLPSQDAVNVMVHEACVTQGRIDPVMGSIEQPRPLDGGSRCGGHVPWPVG